MCNSQRLRLHKFRSPDPPIVLLPQPDSRHHSITKTDQMQDNTDADGGLLAIEVDTDDYADSAAHDTSTVSRTYQSEDAFQAEKRSYTARMYGGPGSNYQELMEAVPALSQALGTGDPDLTVLARKANLSKKNVHLLGYVVGELYYDRDFRRIIRLCEAVRAACDVDKKVDGSLDRWTAREETDIDSNIGKVHIYHAVRWQATYIESEHPPKLGMRALDFYGQKSFDPPVYSLLITHRCHHQAQPPALAAALQVMMGSLQHESHTIADAHPTDIFSLAVTPSQLLSAAGSSSIKVYSTKGQIIHADSAEDEHPYPLVQTLDKVHPLGCHHICTSLDGKVAASIGFGGELKLWAHNDETTQWVGSGELVVQDKKVGERWALALNEDGRFLACTTHDGRINVYDTTTLTPEGIAAQIAHYETKGSFGMSVDISSDGNMTASGHQNGSVYIFNNATQRLVHSLSSLVKPVRSVKFSPACRYLAATGDARIIALYDTQSGEQIANLTGHSSWIMSLDWNWSGEYLLSGCYDGKAKIWSMDRRECVATQTESEKCLWSVKWLPKAATARNETFVTAGAGRTLAFYREASGT
nr:meiotic recombination protein rec14 [Quercus suber]